MKPIARFVYRTENGQPNFLMGVFFKNAPSEFKEGDVWQIEEVLGEYVLKRVGKSIIGPAGYHPGYDVSWNQSVDVILDIAGNEAFLTTDEERAIIAKEEKERKCQKNK